MSKKEKVIIPGMLTNAEKKEYYKNSPYKVLRGSNGKNFVDPETVLNTQLNISLFNRKIGNVLNFNLPVEKSCRHDCECYKNKDGKPNCYACQGGYNFANTQLGYSENYNFFRSHSSADFINAVSYVIEKTGMNKFRFFCSGDFLGSRFLECVVEIAKRFPGVNFWGYTKQYAIVNNYVKNHGDTIDCIPENLTIIFSLWTNDDGTLFPMHNPYNFPVAKFIPYGMEYLAKECNHICPCSNPYEKTRCDNCKTACYNLKPGESMGLFEHSTDRTKERDNYLHDNNISADDWIKTQLDLYWKVS